MSLMFSIPAGAQQQRIVITNYGATIEDAKLTASDATAACYLGMMFSIDGVKGQGEGARITEHPGIKRWISQQKPLRVLDQCTTEGLCRVVAEICVDQELLATDAPGPPTYVSFLYIHKERMDWISDDEVDIVVEPTMWPEWWDRAVDALSREVARIAKHQDFVLKGRIFRTALTISSDVCLSVVAEYRMEIPVGDLEHIVGKVGVAQLSRVLVNGNHGEHEFACLGPKISGGATDYALLLVSSRPIACALASIDLEELSQTAKMNVGGVFEQLSSGTAWHSADLEIVKRAIATVLEKSGLPPCAIFIGRVRS